jgi:hypothetical protein
MTSSPGKDLALFQKFRPCRPQHRVSDATFNPLRRFVTNEFREVFWTAAGGVDARSGQMLFHLGHREYAVQYG